MELGTRVKFDHSSILWREHLAGGKRQWTPVRWNKGYMEGVIVGERTLANGNLIYGNGYDIIDVFRPTEHFKAYQVAFNIRQKPVYVLPEDLEEI